MGENKLRFLLFAFFVCFLGINSTLFAQQSPAWYLVSFKDKNDSPYSLDSPSEYLSERAIERRQKNAIAIDSTDLPVNPFYIDSVEVYGVDAWHQTKWLNAVLVYVDDSADLSGLQKSSVVDSIRFMAPYQAPLNVNQGRNTISEVTSSDYDYSEMSSYSATRERIRMIGLDPLMEMGFTGKGIQIAVLDDGYRNVNTIAAFEHLFANNQILGTRNFTNDGTTVYQSGSHGTHVLSTMAGYVKDEFVGSALEANYYLFQTEDGRSEYPVEEMYWLTAAEYADSIGTDIISSSLVYFSFDDPVLNYTKEQLDGETALVSRAARNAADKGIVLFNSAGNEGDKSWQKICFPADAKEILTVGSVNIEGLYSAFSSVGNTSDGRIKPNLMAMGENTALIGSSGEIFYGNGTSFSNPLLAGATASLMQALPEATSNEIKQTLIQSGHQYENPDSLMGYGIPNLYLAFLTREMDSISNLEESEEFWVIPNPFHTNFHILFSTLDSEKVDVSIFDLSGKLVWHEAQFQTIPGTNFYRIDHLYDLAQGMYFVNITTSKKVYSKKVVKY